MNTKARKMMLSDNYTCDGQMTIWDVFGSDDSKPLRVLSLFDGISCGMVALERAGIKVGKYDAYEIDEDAIKVSEHNYPQIVHKGDVFKAVYSEGEYDLLIGGSPCTYWSIARGGQNSNTDGKAREIIASGLGWDLFSQYARALREVKPRWFLYENNANMSDEIKRCISAELGCEPVEIDSADFSAQHRHRYYWTNIPIAEWNPSNITFADIMDEKYEKSRSIAQYKDTYKWSKDGMCISWDTSGKGYYSQASRARKPQQKWNTVCANRAESKGNVWLGNDTIRLVTISELEKLQTLPVGYTSCLCNKEKRGKCIGNGWTVNVIAWIFSGLKEEEGAEGMTRSRAAEECETLEEAYDEGYQQGRADAIDEFADKIREYSGEHYVDCDGLGCQTELVFRTDEWLDFIVEQIKERNND